MLTRGLLIGAVAVALVEWLSVTLDGGPPSLRATTYLFIVNLALAWLVGLGVAGLGALWRAAGAPWPPLPMRRAPGVAATRLTGLLVGGVVFTGVALPLTVWLDGTIVTDWMRQVAQVGAAGGAAGLGALAGIAAARRVGHLLPTGARWVGAALLLGPVGLALFGITALERDVAWAVAACLVVALSLIVVRRPLGRRGRGAALVVLNGALLAALLLPAPGRIWLDGRQTNLWAQVTTGAVEIEVAAPSGRSGERPSGPAVAKHLVLISVDTLRARSMGTYGYEAPTDPAIAAFFADGIRFDRAYSTAPHSIPAVGSLLTGRHPQQLPWRKTRRPSLDPAGTETIAERLKAEGFGTHLVLYTRYFLAPGVTQGFDQVLENPVPADAEPPPWKRLRDGPMAERGAALIRELALRPGRHFVWMHFMGPHEPYLPHPTLPDLGPGRHGRYAKEIRYTDAALQQVFAALEESGWLDEALVVLTADHGEAFGEHGRTYHGKTLFEEELRVPLLMRWPQASARVVGAPASLVDVLPTALDLLGLPVPTTVAGESWGPLLREGGAPPRRAGVLATRFKVTRMKPLQHAWITAGRKWLLTPSLGPIAAYDLAADPMEKAPEEDPADAPLAAVKAALAR